MKQIRMCKWAFSTRQEALACRQVNCAFYYRVDTYFFAVFFSSFLFRQRRYANKPHKYAIHVRVNDFPSFLFLSSKLINLQEVRYIFIYYRLTVYSYR